MDQKYVLTIIAISLAYAGLLDIVGGAPVTAGWAAEINNGIADVSYGSELYEGTLIKA